MLEVNCVFCGKPFNIKPYRLRKARFCSLHCWNSWRYLHDDKFKKTFVFGKRWSDNELVLVKNLYPSLGAKELALKLNRSLASIKYIVKKLKLKRIRSTRNSCRCLKCGSVFYAPLSQKRKYCSHQCYALDYRGRPKPPMSVEWRKNIAHNHWSKRRPSHRRGLSMEEEYGEARAKQLKAKLSYDSRRRWTNPEFAKKVLKHLHSKPNGLEQKFMNICLKYDLPYRYVGDGSYLIGSLNPDFIHKDGKQIAIEIFGRAFHDQNYKYKIKEIPYTQTAEGRTKIFKEKGWQCIIFWDTELNNRKVEENVLSKLGGMTN